VEQGLLGLRFASTKIPGFSRCGFLKPTSYNDAMSITKRYFTSLRNMRSYASLIFWIGITSTSAVSLCDHDSFPRLHAIPGMLQSTLQKSATVPDGYFCRARTPCPIWAASASINSAWLESAACKMMFRVPEAVVRTAVARPLGKNAYEPLKLVALTSAINPNW
jgi:hypothetical protein